ncbi:hypothetical protein NVIRPANT_00448 [Pantoea sp. Nvir]|nr:hypothetical protein NVIRPANT_00448 [Pantoea sp. Nvir]
MLLDAVLTLRYFLVFLSSKIYSRILRLCRTLYYNYTPYLQNKKQRACHKPGRYGVVPT